MQCSTEVLAGGGVQLSALRRPMLWILGLLVVVFGLTDPVDAQPDPAPLPSGVALWHSSGPFGVATICCRVALWIHPGWSGWRFARGMVVCSIRR